MIAFFSIAMLMSFASKDCSILKNNSFTYRTGGEDVLVVFEESKHAEYHNDNEFYIKSDIEWISDCEYYLTVTETTLPNFPFEMGAKLHIIINKVKGEKVYYTSSLGGKSWEGRLTMVKE
ncbi:hypothetical protein BTO04_10730 [Polaribacter sp. SA4-10]|nr:hypothetical protein BTO04_10730 [Polaribacter sp. SA4-10]